MLHHMLLEIAQSLSISTKREIKLPPFPEKHFKLVTDHFSDEFIDNRKILLENYLKTIITMKVFKNCHYVTSFLIPDKDEIVLPAAELKNKTTHIPTQAPMAM
eukprot:UN30383